MLLATQRDHGIDLDGVAGRHIGRQGATLPFRLNQDNFAYGPSSPVLPSRQGLAPVGNGHARGGQLTPSYRNADSCDGDHCMERGRVEMITTGAWHFAPKLEC
jgi:hypothetical protein